MLEWDRKLLPRERDIGAIGGSGQRVLAAACIHDVVLRLGDSFAASLGPGLLTYLRNSLQALRDREHCSTAETLVKEGEALLEREENLGVGEYDLIMAIVTSLDIGDSEPNPLKCLEAMSYAYQVVLNRRILSSLDGEHTEMKVSVLERSDFVCIAAIERQLNMLAMLQRGEAIHMG